MRSSAWSLLVLATASWGCRDWDRFEATGGAGASGPTTGGSGGAGASGAGGAGGAPMGGAGGEGATAGAGAAGAGGAGGGGGQPPCGLIDALTDDFAAGPLQWRWDTYFSGVGVGDGHLQLSVAPGEYAELWSHGLYDVRGRTFTAEVAPLPDGVGFWFTIGTGYADYVEFYRAPDGMLFAYIEIDDVDSTPAGVPYDPDLHRFFRFRNDGQNMIWELSADGQMWGLLYDLPADLVFDPQYVGVFTGAALDMNAAAPVLVEVEGVWGETDASPACPADTPTDAFQDGSIEPVWRYSGNGCNPVEAGGMFRFECGAGGEGYLESVSFYDLSAAPMTVELTSTLGAGVEFIFGFENPVVDDYAFVIVSDGYLELVHDDGNGGFFVLDEGPSPEQPRFLRLGGTADGTLRLDVSDDGTNWSVAAEGSTPFDLSMVRIGNVAILDAAATGTISIDNFNLGPDP